MSAGPGYTDATGVWHFGEADDEGSISDTLNLLPDSLAAVVTALKNRLTALEAQPSGLVPLKPAAVAGTGVSAAADGWVTFTNATTITLNGIFDGAKYRNYKLVIEQTAGTADSSLRARLRLASTDSIVSYLAGRMAAVNTTVSSGATGVTDMLNLGYNGIRYGSIETTFDSPAAARNTISRSLVSGFNNSGDTIEELVTGRHTVATAYDGITILAGSGNVTGRLRMYGLA